MKFLDRIHLWLPCTSTLSRSSGISFGFIERLLQVSLIVVLHEVPSVRHFSGISQ